jgi:hypothetical protein
VPGGTDELDPYRKAEHHFSVSVEPSIGMRIELPMEDISSFDYS